MAEREQIFKTIDRIFTGGEFSDPFVIDFEELKTAHPEEDEMVLLDSIVGWARECEIPVRAIQVNNLIVDR